MSKNTMTKLVARANYIVSQYGLAAEARERIDAEFDKYAEFAQAAPGQPGVVIVDIPFVALGSAVGIDNMPVDDAVELARVYLDCSVGEHVDQVMNARAFMDAERRVVVIALAPRYITMVPTGLVRTKEYNTNTLPPFVLPAPRKRARPCKAAEPAEPAEPTE